ncbi:predicted protein [Chaetomium globosum CBS 148.51]|uniref:Uncharacterized protein n=1 Tax=Chaetomium globosum (strain ATCC 6205 / CBS 148.51 / DSM 1962 / NBRC 6347 / NRRL 1970) TaxID=306901 RepID=Q2GTU2_CHAGB|nr:uncharacterized protein CHGG_08612 [Chaetomium globosum CBS 148.51]EAQ84598.1 predicted protein [Chaetomium globosum CBS 148.51]
MASRCISIHGRSAFTPCTLRAMSSTTSIPPELTSAAGGGGTDTLPGQKQTGPSAVEPPVKKKKTQKEMDEELKQKMEGISGDGGASGVVYEDGKPVAMRRSVRENMFRYI